MTRVECLSCGTEFDGTPEGTEVHRYECPDCGHATYECPDCGKTALTKGTIAAHRGEDRSGSDRYESGRLDGSTASSLSPETGAARWSLAWAFDTGVAMVTTGAVYALGSVGAVVGAVAVVLLVHYLGYVVVGIVGAIGVLAGVEPVPVPPGVPEIGPASGRQGAATFLFLVFVLATAVILLVFWGLGSVVQLPVTVHYVGEPLHPDPYTEDLLFATPGELFLGPEPYYLIPPVMLAGVGALFGRTVYDPEVPGPTALSGPLVGPFMAPWYLLFGVGSYAVISFLAFRMFGFQLVALDLQAALVIGLAYPTVFGAVGGVVGTLLAALGWWEPLLSAFGRGERT